jgi:hypothetical protein
MKPVAPSPIPEAEPIMRLTTTLTFAAAALFTLAAPAALRAQTAPAPEIYFRGPANGDVVPATFPVVFGLRNYGVAPAGVNLANTGHFHILINVEAPAVGVVIPAD